MSVLESLSVKCLVAVGLLVGVTLHAAGFQPLPPAVSEPDLLRYALTQGGLLGVALVLLYFYRRDITQQIARKDERLEYFASMVAANTAAMERMATAVERLDERRQARGHV